LTSICELFAESAARHGEAVALEVGSVRLSYRDLQDTVLRMAGYLRSAVPGGSGRVGLQADKTPAAYICYLALLRLGRTVVPVAPGAPLARTEAVARESALDAVLSAAGQPGARPCVPMISLDSAMAEARHGRRLSGQPYPDEDTDAYILFTSGSTGVPKGIPITHGNVLSYLSHVIPASELDQQSRVSQTFSLTFDPSIFDLFATWGAGAAMIVPVGNDLVRPGQYVNRAHISHWFSVPSVITLAARSRSLAPGSMPTLRWSGFIGEPLTLGQAQAWHLAAPGSVIENVYGPTELTVACTSYRLPPQEADWPVTANETVPIGMPYPQMEHLVVGTDGVPSSRGELCLRGAQRFFGYVREQDNAGRFYQSTGGIAWAPDVRPPVDRSLWYRTGDIVEASDGTLLHIGRLDRQLKVRGYRIEPEEIETVLRLHVGVEEAVVALAGGPASADLVAFVTGAADGVDELRQHLRERLPQHLIPARIVRVDGLPVNARGKIDHRQAAAMAAQYHPAAGQR
jgi:amino acid adenylation domain-containing protein